MREEIATKLGLIAVDRIFDFSKKQEPDLIAIGLALGYFIIFLTLFRKPSNVTD